MLWLLEWLHVTISIHASLAGGDAKLDPTAPDYEAFQSTPPSREATMDEFPVLRPGTFQSTPPSREATLAAAGAIVALPISIHASLAGGDWAEPCYNGIASISIHASLAGGDRGGRA